MTVLFSQGAYSELRAQSSPEVVVTRVRRLEAELPRLVAKEVSEDPFETCVGSWMVTCLRKNGAVQVLHVREANPDACLTNRTLADSQKDRLAPVILYSADDL